MNTPHASPTIAARPVRRAVRGTTMLELLVIVGIIGLMAGMLTVTSTQNETIALDQAAVLLQDACTRAQGLARSGRAPVGVVFDVQGNRFAIVTEDGTPARDPLTRTDAIVNLSGPNKAERVTLEEADFGAAGAAALFDAQGVPITGGSLRISRGGRTRTLSLDAATGELIES